MANLNKFSKDDDDRIKYVRQFFDVKDSDVVKESQY